MPKLKKSFKSIDFVPHKYQEPLIELSRNNDFFGMFAFPGSGKTAISLDMIYTHKEPTLIIAPLEIMYTTWMTENKKWTFSRNLKSTILHGPNKNQNFYKNVGVYFINPEGIKWLLDKIATTKRFPWKILVVDESVKFKNHKSKRFKELCKMLKTFDKRYILSGNPMPNHYLDLWAQVYILDLGKRLGSSWYQFRNKYFMPTDYKRFNWVLRPHAKEEIIEAISDIVYFLDVSDELDLPTRNIIDVPICLPQSAQKKYKQMEQKLFAELDGDNTVLANNKTSALIKCWQIANGFLYESEEQENKNTGKTQMVRIKTHQIHDSLIVHAKLIVEELQGQSVLIAYHFEEDRKRLQKAFPSATIVESGCDPMDIKRAEKNWNNNKIEILLVHIAKFSHGLNLQLGKGHHILLYTITYNYDVYDQLIRRFERQGAKFPMVIVHRLIVQNTIHEAIIANLERKGVESNDFLQSLKEYRDSIGCF